MSTLRARGGRRSGDGEMNLPVSGHTSVPPGFRFHPTEDELLHYYLRKKVNYEKIDMDVIKDVDLNRLEPWDIQGMPIPSPLPFLLYLLFQVFFQFWSRAHCTTSSIKITVASYFFRFGCCREVQDRIDAAE